VQARDDVCGVQLTPVVCGCIVEIQPFRAYLSITYSPGCGVGEPRPVGSVRASVEQPGGQPQLGLGIYDFHLVRLVYRHGLGQGDIGEPTSLAGFQERGEHHGRRNDLHTVEGVIFGIGPVLGIESLLPKPRRRNPGDRSFGTEQGVRAGIVLVRVQAGRGMLSAPILLVLPRDQWQRDELACALGSGGTMTAAEKPVRDRYCPSRCSDWDC